jgi:hypothetical protein
MKLTHRLRHDPSIMIRELTGWCKVNDWLIDYHLGVLSIAAVGMR